MKMNIEQTQLAIVSTWAISRIGIRHEFHIQYSLLLQVWPMMEPLTKRLVRSFVYEVFPECTKIFSCFPLLSDEYDDCTDDIIQ